MKTVKKKMVWWNKRMKRKKKKRINRNTPRKVEYYFISMFPSFIEI